MPSPARGEGTNTGAVLTARALAADSIKLQPELLDQRGPAARKNSPKLRMASPTDVSTFDANSNAVARRFPALGARSRGRSSTGRAAPHGSARSGAPRARDFGRALFRRGPPRSFHRS